MSGRWVKLGDGLVRIDVAIADGIGQCIVFHPLTDIEQKIGVQRIGMTDEVPNPYIPSEFDTVISLGNVDSAKLLLHQVQTALDEMLALAKAVQS